MCILLCMTNTYLQSLADFFIGGVAVFSREYGRGYLNIIYTHNCVIFTDTSSLIVYLRGAVQLLSGECVCRVIILYTYVYVYSSDILFFQANSKRSTILVIY